MADYQQGYAYCSPFLSVRSLDVHLAWPRSPVFRLVDTEDDPEIALQRSEDNDLVRRWVESLPHGLQHLAEALMRGESQVDVARREGVSEAAVSKRMAKLRDLGRRDLSALRRSPLLN